jgi:hypothetical protein
VNKERFGKHSRSPASIPLLRSQSDILRRTPFDTSLNDFLHGRSAETDLIGKHLNSIDSTNFPVSVARVDFVLNKDPEFRPPNIPRLTIEKRAHTQFSQHRYFSTAPIHTAKHLEILERIDRGLRRGKN